MYFWSVCLFSTAFSNCKGYLRNFLAKNTFYKILVIFKIIRGNLNSTFASLIFYLFLILKKFTFQIKLAEVVHNTDYYKKLGACFLTFYHIYEFHFFFINFNLFDFPQRPTFVEFDFPTQDHLIQYQLLNSPSQIHLIHLLIQPPIVHYLKKLEIFFP